MAPPAPTRPTREQCLAALDLVLAESLNKTEAAAYLGCSYLTLVRNKTVPSFMVGREERYWIADLDQVGR